MRRFLMSLAVVVVEPGGRPGGGGQRESHPGRHRPGQRPPRWGARFPLPQLLPEPRRQVQPRLFLPGHPPADTGRAGTGTRAYGCYYYFDPSSRSYYYWSSDGRLLLPGVVHRRGPAHDDRDPAGSADGLGRQRPAAAAAGWPVTAAVCIPGWAERNSGPAPSPLPSPGKISAVVSPDSTYGTTEDAMNRKPTTVTESEAPAVTADRAARLYRMLRLVAASPPDARFPDAPAAPERSGILPRPGGAPRRGIPLEARASRYTLQDDLNAAVTRLPLPDPHLTLGEAMKLPRRRLRAHRKLKGLIEQVVR